MWQQLAFETEAAYVEVLSEKLMLLGAVSVTYIDAKDQPLFEPKPGEMLLWRDIVVTALFEADIDAESVMTFCQRESNIHHPRIAPLEDQDWSRVWMKDFKPMRFGQHLWVCPSWCEPPDPKGVVVMLDPGLAFGTGTHPTTSLCLTALDALSLQGKSVLDYGCGSGILAIAAKKLGATEVYAVDNDPQALDATRSNASHNQVLLHCELAEHFSSAQQADIVIANILSSILIELAPQLTAHCRDRLILSGILESQIPAVVDAFSANFVFDAPKIRGEWVCLLCQKK